MNCRIDAAAPFLDFSFRFEIGYIVACPLRQFAGKGKAVGTVLRVRNESGTVTYLGQSMMTPLLPEEFKDPGKLQHLRAELEFSGVFSAGSGEYQIDLAVFDEGGRIRKKHWKARAAMHRREGEARLSLKPGEVEPISLPHWNGPRRGGLHLSVLLDAAPMNPRSIALRAWDRAFLLGVLSTALREVPLASVHLVAFNLEQQIEVYREAHFDGSNLETLAGALDKLELGKISYKNLRATGQAAMLAQLVREETQRHPPSDAVIFLGAAQQPASGYPDEYLQERPFGVPPFFYLEYYPERGSEFPDLIERLTRRLGGATFKLHSPAELAEALAKLRRRLKRGE